MKIELAVGQKDFVGCESVNDDTERVAANLKLVHGITGDLDLIIKRRISDRGEALVSDGRDAVKLLDVFCDFGHEKLRCGGLDAERQRGLKVNITGNDFDLVDVAISDGNDIHCVDVLDFGGAEIDGKDLTDVVAKFNDVTNIVVIVGNDFEAAKNILHGILESKTNDD